MFLGLIMAKILIPLSGKEIAPRFDLSTEAWVGWVDEAGDIARERVLVLAHPSAEDMCQLILNEKIEVVICNGIEAQYYDYLQWKKVQVIDGVMATAEQALAAFARQALPPGSVLLRPT